LGFSAMRVTNSFPTMMAGLSTSQPLQLQLAVLLGTSTVGLTLFAAGLALIAGAPPVWAAATGRLESPTVVTLGLALGARAAGRDVCRRAAARRERASVRRRGDDVHRDRA